MLLYANDYTTIFHEINLFVHFKNLQHELDS